MQAISNMCLVQYASQGEQVSANFTVPPVQASYPQPPTQTLTRYDNGIPPLNHTAPLPKYMHTTSTYGTVNRQVQPGYVPTSEAFQYANRTQFSEVSRGTAAQSNRMYSRSEAPPPLSGGRVTQASSWSGWIRDTPNRRYYRYRYNARGKYRLLYCT